MNPAERTTWVRERAAAVGFDLCGIVSLSDIEALRELAHLPKWLGHGYAGEMQYLHDPRRIDPQQVMPGARSAVVVALNYSTGYPYSTDAAARVCATSPESAPTGWVSRYAWGDDYHEVLGEKLDTLVAAMRAEFADAAEKPFLARAYVDTGPVSERVLAKYGGLGWLAKNTCLINEGMGSWIFLGTILTTLELAPSLGPGEPPPADLCGNCRLCLDACPTQAFPEPYVLDATRCISYLTIELRGAIPEELRPAMGRAVVGCDICQDVCPWNRKAPVTQLAAFQPRSRTSAGASRDSNRTPGNGCEPPASLFEPSLEWLASSTQEEFNGIFRGSAVKRAKWRGVIRNACLALGNSHQPRDSKAGQRVLMLLSRLADSDDSLIAEHARWAIARLALQSPLVGGAL